MIQVGTSVNRGGGSIARASAAAASDAAAAPDNVCALQRADTLNSRR